MRRHSQGFLTLVYFHDNYRTSSTNILFFLQAHLKAYFTGVPRRFLHRLTTRYISYTKDELLRVISYMGEKELGYVHTIRHETDFAARGPSPWSRCEKQSISNCNRFVLPAVCSTKTTVALKARARSDVAFGI